LSNVRINADQLSEAIKNTLDDYNESIVKSLKRQTKRAMKDLVNNTKNDAPVGHRSKHYRDSITSRTESNTKYGVSLLWYVKGSDYRLSHLLNNGHASRNGGRVKGTNFIGRNVDRIIDWYVPVIEEICKNGK
jgi:hypothetical protein